jgi:hypothetical protein
MERTVQRLVSWLDAAAVRNDLDPVKDALEIAYLLDCRRLAGVAWWRRHTQQERMERAPSVRLQRAVRRVYLERTRPQAA